MVRRTMAWHHESGWLYRRTLSGWVCSVLLLGGAHGGEFQDEPWSVSPAAPAMATPPTPTATSAGSAYVSVSRAVCFGWLIFYQRVLHVVTVSHCPLHPSCSNYSIAAINKHGAFRGIILTADRLLHESDEQYYAPLIRRNGRSLYADPVESNDFWWKTR